MANARGNTSGNTIEIVVRAVDQATRPLREIGREVDALAVRLRQSGGAGAGISAGWSGLSMPTSHASRSGAPTPSSIHQTTVVQVMLPEAALRDLTRAEAAGERLGEAIARRLRERG